MFIIIHNEWKHMFITIFQTKHKKIRIIIIINQKVIIWLRFII